MALSIDPGYLRRLVVKVRSFMGKEAQDLPDDASNPTDDAMPASALQDEEDDLSREEVVEEIRGLEPREQAELVALMWLGRDEGDPEEFEALVAFAGNLALVGHAGQGQRRVQQAARLELVTEARLQRFHRG